jgi:hypothetical protein
MLRRCPPSQQQEIPEVFFCDENMIAAQIHRKVAFLLFWTEV